MILTLPSKTRQLVDRYLNLRIGKHLVQCPYYENITKKKSRSVFVGKGLPEDVERETLRVFENINEDVNKSSLDYIRYTMLMAGLGVDCSGLAVRILDCFLTEKNLGGIKKAIRPPNNLIGYLRWQTRIYASISANQLTNKVNCATVNEIDKVLPGDLIRFGKLHVAHVAIVTEIEKVNNVVKSIIYCHSTSSYYEQYGVRIGKIQIIEPNKGLEKQEWAEVYRDKDSTKKDYLGSSVSDRGIRRLRILANTFS